MTAQERSFDPGDQVLALLPIAGNPLQARYYGPYTIEKKLSDLNYVVNTQGRHKQRQLCHIDMLKPYISRDDSVSQKVAFVNTVLQKSDRFDDGSDELGKPDPGQTKLQNSEILQNLDDKL